MLVPDFKAIPAKGIPAQNISAMLELSSEAGNMIFVVLGRVQP